MESRNPIEVTIENTDKSVDKYIVNKMSPSIILNHLEKFTSHLKDNDCILDIGCGHGRDCRYFEDNGYRVVGIDLSSRMLKIANDVCNRTVLLHMDIRDIGRIPWKFNGIWSCASFHHIPKIYANDVIGGMHKILSDDGIVFITVKRGDGEGFAYKNDLDVEKFYSLYDETEMRNIMEENHFEIIDMFVEKKKYTWLNVYAKKIL